ncbi:hypothetical protein [Nonomuraea sp. NPDC050310]|uniref:TolB family protein n=1 Tax=unclassified Nonomuraea TaxID=2593643 RepID=UPI0033DC2C57
MKRVLIVSLAALLLGLGVTGYAWWRSGPVAGAPEGLLVRDAASGLITGTDRRCERFYRAADTGVCLVVEPGAVPKTFALVLDRNMREVRRVRIAGIPSRARVSASGRMISWTVFVTGDSYNSGGFSTWTGILDTKTGYLVTNMEEIPLFLDGKRYYSVDVNYWGVSFAADDNRFYATVSTKGRTYLVEGDYANWRAKTLAQNVECPSLSPDGTRLAFKKRMPGGDWRLHVLDLATMRQTPLGEPANVDDQAAWLDTKTVLYGRAGDVWSVPADGTGQPKRLVTGASSPVPFPAAAAAVSRMAR